jgi:hypothetical protein
VSFLAWIIDLISARAEKQSGRMQQLGKWKYDRQQQYQ